MIKLLTFNLASLDPNQEMDQTVKILGMENRLRELGLSLSFPESNIQAMELDLEKGTSTIRCPHCPTDLKASRGVRRSKKDPSKRDFVFGYDAIRVTLINPLPGFEAPCEAGTYTGKTYEGDHFITLRKRIKDLHPYLNIRVDLGDGHYDNVPDYDWCRESGGSEPLFDYNARGEKVDEETLRKRGYDKNGTPLTTCGLLTKWRAYDPAGKRSSFSCEK